MHLSNSWLHMGAHPLAEHLLTDFQRVRQENTPLPEVVLETLQKTLGPCSEMLLELPLGKALMRLSQAVQDDTDAQPDKLDYHNIAHFREAVMAVGHLSALEFEGQKACPHFVVLSMMAMVGHDFKHDGTSNTPGKSLEAMAWQACEPHLEGVHEKDMDALEAIILGTDPTKLNEHRTRYAQPGVSPEAIDRLRLLACEADLTPSLMPGHGVAMGKLFAAELSSSGVDSLETLGKTISTWESRLGFLRHATPISAAADKFGLAQMHTTQLQAFAALSDSLGLTNDKEAAQHLDILEAQRGPEQASQLYMAALAHVDSRLGQHVAKVMNMSAPTILEDRLAFGM